MLPLANLKVVQVVACFNSAVGLLDQSWPVDFLGKDCEDRNLTLLQRVRSDDSLLTELFAGFESTQLHDLGSQVDQNAEAMRSETCLLPDDLAPEMVAFELTLVNIKLFNILTFPDKFILHKKFDIKLEMLVFLDAVLNIFVNPSNCEFYFLEIAKNFNDRSILLFLDQAWRELPSAALIGLQGCIGFLVVLWCS